jgi:hypothetical protein
VSPVTPVAAVRRPLPLRALLGAATLALLLHALLLGAWPAAPGPGWRAQTPRPLSVRQIVATAPAPTVAPRVEAPATPPQRATATAPAPVVADDDSAHATSPAAPAAAPEPADTPAPPPGGAAVPVYATRLPPPATLQYTLRRGRAQGVAQLDWQPDGGRYRLQMNGLLLGARFIAWDSQGGLDAHGVAPERYVESRRGREARALNFQRDSGRITFSGPQLEYPLIPGAQDRLSWLLQLPAVLAANPALAQPGAAVQLFVVGTRGDAEVWTFTFAGRENVDLPGGTLADTLHLHREPLRRYDTQVDVWLDPARHHLPVRARLQTAGGRGEGTEFLLEQMALP